MFRKPITTLFMLMSIDGKISTGMGNIRDFDKDLPHISGVAEGLHQYYEIEKETDLWSLNSGAVMKKMGVNANPNPKKTHVNFVVIDNSHLNKDGVRHFINRSSYFVLVTSNPNHPAFYESADNMDILFYNNSVDFKDMFEKLNIKYNCGSITLQTGGTLNGIFLREGLIDKINIIVAPVMVGGVNTPTLIDGKSLETGDADLNGLGVLKLTNCKPLMDSYIQLEYNVINNSNTTDNSPTYLFK